MYSVKSYIELCKPKVVMLMLLSAIVGMILATHLNIGTLPHVFWGLAGIALAASAGAVVNHIIDQHFDSIMRRTQRRPLPQGTLPVRNAIVFAIILASASILLMWYLVNPLATILTIAAMLGYAFIYTMFLKHATPQNIVIGGLSGALPPLLGWVSITGQMSAQPWLLVLIIFAWTPPHFWALAIDRIEDYKKANIPMLPVTHGIAYTKLQILLYTILMALTTILPLIINMFGLIYLLAITLLNSLFIYQAWQLHQDLEHTNAKKLFWFSIKYLMWLFVAMIVDHYCFIGL